MRSAFGWVIAIFAAFWLFRIGLGIARDLAGPIHLKMLLGLMGLFVLLGAAGFFGAALSATGMLKLPKSFEWPAGYVTGVVRTTEGEYVVPLVPSGRIQIYDSSWHFLRGWHVDAEGGDFVVDAPQDGTIEVFTARGRHHYSFTKEGGLISATTLSGNMSDLRKTGESLMVPTSPLLWVFSSPFLSIGLATIGFGGMTIVKNLARGQ
jgi:hypothetical protein